MPTRPDYGFYRDEEGNRRVTRRDAVVCDFCLTPEPRWQYPAGPMDVPHNPVMNASDDEWLACDRCHALIDGHKLGALVERVVHVQRELVPAGTVTNEGVVGYPPLPIHRRRARETMLRFFDARLGPATPFP